MNNSVVIDVCVLYSAALRDFLLWLAQSGLFHPLWSDEIRRKWIDSLLQNRPDLKREKLEHTCREMDAHFPNSLVRGYESIIQTLPLPDPKDRHVLAAAIHAKAEYVVTFNLDDFPNAILRSYNIEAVSLEEFVLQLIRTAPDRVLRVVKRYRLNLSRPAKTVDEYLATLEKQGLAKTVAILRKHKDEI